MEKRMEPPTDEKNARRPWLALVVSLLFPGLGQIYCGRVGRGVFFFCGSFVSVPTAFILPWLSASSALLWILIVSGAASLLFFLLGAVDAFLLARRLLPGYKLRACNRWAVYVPLALVGTAFPFVLRSLLIGHAFQAFKIPSRSMEPTIQRGDHVLVNRVAYRSRKPLRGEIIVFRPPGKPETHYIRRIIAVGGDTVEIRGFQVLVNGKPLVRKRVGKGPPAPVERYIEQNHKRSYMVTYSDVVILSEMPETKVPSGHVFVLGDQRSSAADSFKSSLLPPGNVVGPVTYRYLPLSRLGVVDPFIASGSR